MCGWVTEAWSTPSSGVLELACDEERALLFALRLIDRGFRVRYVRLDGRGNTGSLGSELERNFACVEALVRDAAARGARVVLTPELIEGPSLVLRRVSAVYAGALNVCGSLST